LIWIPVAALFLSIGLCIVIARQLSLSYPLTALAALCMAFAPSTRLLHGVGEIDHHFAELIFVLGSLAAGLRWFMRGTIADSVLLGATLGLAVAVHNGLFVLQIPLLATILFRWLQGISAPRQHSLALALSLAGFTFAALAPSLAFQTGRFEFYTLSWFHAYIAVATAVLIVFMSRTAPSRTVVLGLGALSLALLAGILTQLQLAGAFLGGTIERLQTVMEMRSLLTLVFENTRLVTNFYSYLIWLAPLTWILCVVQCWRRRTSTTLIFWMTCVWGLALLSTQLRMHYFGAFALYLPWLILVHEISAQYPEQRRRITLGATLSLLLAYVPLLRYELLNAPPKGADVWYERVEPLLPVLRDACAEDPGIVLADSNLGHYIRYATDCSVIANNFLLTPQHFQKMDLVDALFSRSPPDLVNAAAQPKYVLVRASGVFRSDTGEHGFSFFGAQPQLLSRQLLLDPPDSLPPEYRLFGQILLPGGNGVAYARLYKIERGSPAPAASSR
jgi:hypothetical protein